jgi:hypothetical protein
VSFNNTMTTVASSFFCNNGLYSINYIPTKAGLNKVMVSGAKSSIQNNPGSVFVIPGPLSTRNTYVDTLQNMYAGQIDPFWIYARDYYNNTITTCTIPSSQYNQFFVQVVLTTLPYQQYNATVTYCTGGVYQGRLQMNVTGTYSYKASFSGSNIYSLKPFVYVTAGFPSAQYSIARGPGVDPTQLIIAGTWATFYIDYYNQYGVRIASNAICQPITWTVTFVPSMSAYPGNRNVTFGTCSLGTIPVYYNATTAGYYSIYISGNSVPILGNPYHSQVIPTILDPARTGVEGLLQTFITFGTFTLVGRDIYGNPGVNLTNNLFTVSLSPPCSQSSLCCNFLNGKLVCNFWVTEGGRYCVNINYKGQILALNTSSLLVYGGAGCGSGGCIHGFCYPVNPNSQQYSCSCSPGYTHVDCSVPINPENAEPLSLPAPPKTIRTTAVADDIAKLSKAATHSIEQPSTLKKIVDNTFVVVALVAGVVFGAFLSKRRISSA